MPEVARFYYSRALPPKAVGIAEITARPSTPEDLVDIHHMPLRTPRAAAPLTVTRYPAGTVTDAKYLHVEVAVSDSLQYLVENQFFEITNVSSAGLPLFYKHTFEVASIENASVFTLDGKPVAGTLLREGVLYHSLEGDPYWVRYYSDGVLRTELLRYLPVLSRRPNPSNTSYAFSPGGLITVFDDGPYWLRFTRNNAWAVLPPYNVPANDPWYPRIRFNLKPVAREWAKQPFMPQIPWMLATWVPGKVLAPNIVEFERQPAYFDGSNYPDILVYDRDWNLKFALDGTEPDSRVDKGNLFPWMRSQFVGFDETHARAHVAVNLAPDDQPFGFYSYEERDVIFRELDVNPFTNPGLRDKIIEFYYADRNQEMPG